MDHAVVGALLAEGRRATILAKSAASGKLAAIDREERRMETSPAFNPVLLDVPDRFETARLLLRAPRPGDGAMIHASVLETLEDLRRFPASMLWALSEQLIEKSEEYARQGAAHWIVRAEFPMLALHRGTGEHVGNVGMHRLNWETRVFEIGWWCRKRFQGQGLITEAARALTEFAFGHLGARRVWCGCDEDNEKSWRVAERLGFELEGTLRSERCDPDGTRRSMRVYATTR
jgi:RimJ/RimL family protein N-acetyltransferase